ncbi:MAG: hypothetical protein FWE87_03230 [Coriobacteriia bacterium]|nr:hypothetical protein [Coriobacteriia bacterium]
MKSIDSTIIKRSLPYWLIMLPLGVANGAFRDIVLTPFIGSIALPLSGISLAALIVLVSWIMTARLGKASRRTFLALGVVWVVLTIAFEFFFGMVIEKNTFEELISAYNVLTGNLWSIDLLVILLAPWVVAHSRGLSD